MTTGSESKKIEQEIALPLCVDLDGTVVISDTLLESLLRLARRTPLMVFSLPGWLLSGKARFKAKLAEHVSLDPKSLPYNELVLDYLRAEKAKGRELILATAANEKIAASIAEHLGIFDSVVASDSDTNMSGKRKLERFKELFGEGGFDYVANAKVDLPIWSAGREVIVVNPERGVLSALQGDLEPALVIETPRPKLTTVLEAIRLYQWLKNALIFIPLLAAHQWELSTLVQAGLAFVAFGLCASGGYLINDMLDLAVDRAHPTKKNRPMASGVLSIPAGATISIGIIATGLIIGGLVQTSFFWLLALYLLSTLSYSLYLKKLVLVDVITLAGLYTLRVIAGGAAVAVDVSFWLLAFSMFVFLSLALVKRAAELQTGTTSGKVKGRGYTIDDLEPLRTMGITAGYLSVLVIALYINSDDVVLYYERPEILWLICPVLLFWVSRLWIGTSRGEMHHDPLVYAVKDRISQLAGIVIALTVLLAI